MQSPEHEFRFTTPEINILYLLFDSGIKMKDSSSEFRVFKLSGRGLTGQAGFNPSLKS